MEIENHLGDYTNALKTKMWITRGVRFEAYNHYLGKHALSNFAISFFSAYVIIINFLSIYKVVSSDFNLLIQFSTMTLSVLILAFSQLESANDYKLKAERFHDCSKEISKLLNELNFLLSKKNISSYSLEQNIKSISDQYDIVIQRFSENHSAIHYKAFNASYPYDFPNEFLIGYSSDTSDVKSLKVRYWKIFKIDVQAFLQPRWLYFLLILVPPILFILAIILHP
ncbi:SLATT domain-containing protein [Pontibacter qinzhouensis]|uniref:SLATT domain-containing protein n=1 Tax=Pontibacter qinzhouensis TaxID=2603253 RepID=A0A5C8IH46_9BACT|nr:SLATT domain-containing protein [Pontibacter qinzhouensis]TXK20948.1 SLATT domain-containing protein [Pontibacter qinzhouensis]